MNFVFILYFQCLYLQKLLLYVFLSVAPVTETAVYVSPGNNIQLDCHVDSNLALVNWHFNGQPLQTFPQKHYLYNQGLLIFSTTASDIGSYTCQASEHVGSNEYSRIVAAYKLLPPQPVTPYSGKEDKGKPERKVPVTEPTVSQITAPQSTPAGSIEEAEPNQPKGNTKVSQITGLQVAVALLAVTLVAGIGAAMFFNRRLRSQLRFQARATGNGAAYQPASQDKTDDPRTDQNYNKSTVTFSGKGLNNVPVVAISSIADESEI